MLGADDVLCGTFRVRLAVIDTDRRAIADAVFVLDANSDVDIDPDDPVEIDAVCEAIFAAVIDRVAPNDVDA